MGGLHYIIPDTAAALVALVLEMHLRHEKELYTESGSSRLRFLLLFCACQSAVAAAESWLISTSSSHSPFIVGFAAVLSYLMTPAAACLISHRVVRDCCSNFPDTGRAWLSGARGLFSGVMAIDAVLVAVNLTEPVLFEFDSWLNFVPGPLYHYQNFALLAVCAYASAAMFANKGRLMPQLERMSASVPWIVFACLVLQIFFPLCPVSSVAEIVALLFIFLNTTQASFLVDRATGMGNSLLLASSLDHWFSKGGQFSVVVCAVDDYHKFRRDFDVKSVESMMGALSCRLQSARGARQVFRLSEDVFVVVGPAPSEPSCRLFSDDLMDAFRRPLAIGDVKFSPRGRISLIPCPVVAPSGSVVMEMAVRLAAPPEKIRVEGYSSEDGENVSFVVCDLRLLQSLNRRRRVLKVLCEAISNGGFEVEYQPVFDKDGVFSNMAECLARLQDPSSGEYIPPSEFIPVAESEGLIDDVSAFVLEAGCSMIEECAAAGLEPPTLSVNFSARQFYNPGLRDMIQGALQRHHVQASRLKVEITESYLIENYDTVRAVMEELEADGTGFFLDDFGSGNASLPRYINLQFECVKIDRSLVATALSNIKVDTFLRSVIPCFRRLGCRVVFEGVETSGAMDYVASFGDVGVQGFYCSPPVTSDRFRALVGLAVPVSD